MRDYIKNGGSVSEAIQKTKNARLLQSERDIIINILNDLEV